MVEKVITDDVDDFLKQSPESKVSDSPGLATRDGKKKAIVKGFTTRRIRIMSPLLLSMNRK